MTDSLSKSSIQRPVLTFVYTNYRGATEERRVRPIRLWYGDSGHHTGRQWFLRAFDLDRDGERDFALADVKEITRG